MKKYLIGLVLFSAVALGASTIQWGDLIIKGDLTVNGDAVFDNAVPIAQGGTGQTTKTAAMDALSPTTTKGDVLVDDGTNVVRLAVGTDGYVLKANSGATNGIEWAAESGSALSVTSKTTTYTATTADDVILADTSGGAWTLTLPTAVGNSGKTFIIRKTDSSSNVLTIDGNSSETIDGLTTRAVTKQGDYIEIISDNSNWVSIKDFLTTQIRLYGNNGYGSTNTRIRRFSSTTENVGDAVTYADSAANGGSFTINIAGMYSINYSDTFSANTSLGLSLNSSQLTTDVYDITPADRLIISYCSTGNGSCSVHWTGWLDAGDVVRAHATTTSAGVLPNICSFTINKINK